MSPESQDLRKNYKKLQIELESLSQALYQCQTQMKTTEYQDETNKIFQQQEIKQQKLEAELRSLEEQNINFNEQITYLNMELTGIENELDKVTEEFSELKPQKKDLSVNFHEVNDALLESEAQKAALEEQIKQLQEQLENYKEDIKCRMQNSDIEKRGEEIIFGSYKSQIQDLNQLIDSYKKELKGKDDMLAMKNKEIEELRESLRNRSFNYTTLAYELAEANRKIGRYDLENISLKNEIEKLKTEIKSIEMASP